MKILYVLYFDPNTDDNIGVKKKIDNQVFSVRKLGYEIDIAYLKDSSFIIENTSKIEKKFEVNKGKSNYRSSINKVLKNIVLEMNYSHFYFRFPGSIDWFFFNIIKFISKKNRYVYLELPTYPYDEERNIILRSEKEKKNYFSFLLRSLIYSLEKIYLPCLKKYITKIITFMSHEKIWGIDTVVLENGVDTHKYPPVEYINYSKDVKRRPLTLTGVANVSRWHGYDRIIEGIHVYYSKQKGQHKIRFNIVGNGKEVEDLKKLVRMYELENSVHFLGALYNFEDLKKVYAKTDLAIGSLGMHRINLYEGSTLKVKEYCSMGIPFIISYKEKAISNDFKYALNLPSDDTAINMESLLEFYLNLGKREVISEEMHEFAILNFSWDIQMKKVFTEVD
ncbi:glycosyltransferase [Enterococcus asini]|uniref:glycosyltransferase n=1 Tax=Enterococcus asini TaxID=57732 RepID=UPI001E358BAF|nr:glycosyltransferase [Enterococcus asini]MCD5030039.1 glycosyltransferase [Enterococcus asini]